MHLHSHLREVLSDFGPVQEYWLFSFERYNGLLGNQPTNNRSIEPQLMKRFLLNNFAHSLTLPSEFNSDFNSLCNFEQQPIRGMALEVLSIPTNEIYCLPTRSTGAILNSEDQNFVTLLFQRLHPQTQNMRVNFVFTKYTSLEIRGKCCNANQASISMVKWDKTLFQQQPNIMEEALQIHQDFDCRPARVYYFGKMSFYPAEIHRILLRLLNLFLLLFHGTIDTQIDTCLVSQFKCGVQCLKIILYIILYLFTYLFLVVLTVPKLLMTSLFC